MRILITGITGFAGSHLAEYCLDRGDVEIYGMVRWRSRTENIDHLKNDLNLIDCDIRDASSVTKTLGEVKPDYIFHLAAQSFVPTSWHAPAETLTTNVIGQVNIFEAIRELNINPRVQLACSSEEYGMVYEDEIPIRETNPLRPLSPYAVSKVAQDYLGYQYFQSYGIEAVRTRAFNHSGPRRGEVFVDSNFAKQIAMIEKGLQEPIIKVGNLEAKRDFTDVRDIVRGYWLSLEKCESGEVYNICSGKSVIIQKVLDKLLAMTETEIEILQDPARMRPSDVMILEGDYSKFKEATGWEPTIDYQQTLEDTLNYWREKV